MAIKGELDLEIGKFKAKWAAAVNEVNRGAGQMKRDTGGIGNSIAGGMGGLTKLAGGLGVGALVMKAAQQAKEALTYADDLADLSVKLNENSEALQRVDFAAKQTASVGVEQLSSAMMRLEKNLGDVENKAASDALDRYGLNAEKLMAMPLDKKVLAFSEAFQAARATGSGYADLLDLLGKSAGELVPLFAQSTETLKELFGSAQVVPDETIQRMAEVNDKLDAMKQKAHGLFVELVGGAEAMKEMIGVFLETGSWEQAFEADLEKRQTAQNRIAEIEQARRDQAAALGESRKAAADEAEKKEQATKAEEINTANAKAAARLEDSRLRALPDSEKVGALESKLSALFADKLKGTGLEGEGKEGLARMIAGLNTDYGRERQTGFIEALAEAESIEREVVELKKRGADQAKAEMEARLKFSIGNKTLEPAEISARRGPTGAVQAAVNAIFGRAPGDPLLDENRTQTGLQRAILRKLDQIGQGSGGDDLFSFP